MASMLLGDDAEQYRNLTDPGVPRVPYAHRFALPFEQNIDHIYVTYLFQNYWWHTITVSILYLIAVQQLERWMRPRPPMQLKGALTVWNGGLALFSILGAIRTTEEFAHTMLNEGLYRSLCYCFDPTSVSAHWFLFFAISKVVELGDTVFLAVRKRKLTFLHCYHHCTVLVYTFHSGAEHLAAGRWFMWMNFIAHAFMYSYFTAMSMGVKVPRQLAKCVTIIQITQMFLGISVSLAVYAIKSFTGLPCHQSQTNLSLAFIIYASYAVLFVRFFLEAYGYTKRRSPQEKPAVTKKAD
ncbi:GNS1/SUR4 family protein [Aphelenchoides avenae]|nr:GNS1/SUR4 family protein [Aphelenchus avenae]